MTPQETNCKIFGKYLVSRHKLENIWKTIWLRDTNCKIFRKLFGFKTQTGKYMTSRHKLENTWKIMRHQETRNNSDGLPDTNFPEKIS